MIIKSGTLKQQDVYYAHHPKDQSTLSEFF